MDLNPKQTPAWSRVTTWALLLGVGHALVDAAGGYLSQAAGPGRAGGLELVLLYNLIAFAAQAPLGVLTDRLAAYRQVALAGLSCALLSLLMGPRWATAGVVAAVLVNALFHVGAGALVLISSGVRATEAGVFVGPGAVGLYGGGWLGRRVSAGRWGLMALLGVGLPIVHRLGRGMSGPASSSPRNPRRRFMGLPLLCATGLMGSVYLRALVGGVLGGVWRARSVSVPALLAAAACAGKMAGGFIGDGLGWLPTSLAALVLAAPLITVLSRVAPAAVLGALLFQITMPVTLKATHLLFPDHPGFAFGLPSLFLALGALTLVSIGPWPWSSLTVLGLLALAAVSVTVGLAVLKRLDLAG